MPNRRRIIVALACGFTTELLIVLFNLLTSPDPPRWLGPYKDLVWLQEPGDYFADHEILPGGLLVILFVQGFIYSTVAYLLQSVFHKKSG